ncbi:MAG: VOC family protein [bacterium]
MTITMNGIAHIQLTSQDPERALPFWERLCHFFEMKTLIRTDDVLYCIGSRTGLVVRGAPAEKRKREFDQDSAGLHHFCFRAREHDDINQVHRFFIEELALLGGRVVHGPEDGSEFAPGYYSALYEDPGGIRVEVNHVPGRGHFGKGGRLGEGGAGTAGHFGAGGFTNARA